MPTSAIVGFKFRFVNKEQVIGTYIHYDGQPNNTLVQLIRIIKRDGIRTAISAIVHGAKGWSILDARASYGKPGYGDPYYDMQYPSQATIVDDKCFAPELFYRTDADWAYVVDIEQNVIYVWKCSRWEWKHICDIKLDEIPDLDAEIQRRIRQYCK